MKKGFNDFYFVVYIVLVMVLGVIGVFVLDSLLEVFDEIDNVGLVVVIFNVVSFISDDCFRKVLMKLVNDEFVDIYVW